MTELLRDLLFLPPGASSIADDIDGLHFFVITVTMIGSVFVFASTLYFFWRYHRSRRREVTPRVTPPVSLEAITIGALLGLFLLFWVIGYRQYVTMMARAPDRAIDVHVVGRQWLWTFVDAHARPTQSVLVVPRGQPVRVIATSRDVIHSFFVPAFRIKQDVVPGEVTTIWFTAERTGTYPIFCAEYCGLRHSRMRAEVVVLEPADYARWLDGATPPAVARAGVRGSPPPEEDMVERGRRLAVRYECLACHTVDGQPHIGPSWRGMYGSVRVLEDGQRVRADVAYLTESMMDPESQRVAGFPTVMPSYRGIVPAGDVAAIVEYIESLRGGGAPAVDLPPVAPAGGRP